MPRQRSSVNTGLCFQRQIDTDSLAPLDFCLTAQSNLGYTEQRGGDHHVVKERAIASHEAM